MSSSFWHTTAQCCVEVVRTKSIEWVERKSSSTGTLTSRQGPRRRTLWRQSWFDPVAGLELQACGASYPVCPRNLRTREQARSDFPNRCLFMALLNSRAQTRLHQTRSVTWHSLQLGRLQVIPLLPLLVASDDGLGQLLEQRDGHGQLHRVEPVVV